MTNNSGSSINRPNPTRRFFTAATSFGLSRAMNNRNSWPPARKL
jgi:hypothetical protein